MEIDTILGIALLIVTGALAWATWGLWSSTKKYVELTRDSLAVVESTSAPRLILEKSGRSQVGDTHMDGKIRIRNVGGGLAQEVVIITSWGRAKAKAPVLRPGEDSIAAARITAEEWTPRKGGEDQDPVPQQVQFVDAQGRAREVEVREHVPGSTWVATLGLSTP